MSAGMEARPLTVKEAAERYLGGRMSKRWWYKQIEEGRLPAYQPGRLKLIRLDDIEAFVGGLYREKAEAAIVPPAPLPKRATSRKGGFRFFP